MHTRWPIARGLWFLAGAALLLCVSGAGRSQDLKKNYEKDSAVREQMFTGEIPANPKNDVHKNIVQASAEYFLLRVPQKSADPALLQKEFAANVNKIVKGDKKTAELRKLLGVALVGTIKGELAQDIKTDPSATVQMAMMLPIMARLKQPYVSEYLDTLIEDTKTHDAVRLYALKALKETMPIEAQQELLQQQGNWDFKDKDQNARRDHDVKNVTTLTKYIERPIKIEKMGAEELATLKFLRREAIISLAAAGSPAVYAFAKPPVNDRPKAAGLIAPTLLKVLIKGALHPEPTIQEKVEAALGLCYMDYTYMPEYQPEVAVYLVGQTLIEFAQEYNKDWGKFKIEKGKLAPFVAFKVDAKRFQAGLERMSANARASKDAAKSAPELERSADKWLKLISNYGQIPALLQDLDRTVTASRPKNGKVFKTLEVKELVLP